MKRFCIFAFVLVTANAIATGQDYNGYRFARQGYGSPSAAIAPSFNSPSVSGGGGWGAPQIQQPHVGRPHGHGQGRRPQQNYRENPINFGGAGKGVGGGGYGSSGGGFGGPQGGGGGFNNAPIKQDGYGGGVGPIGGGGYGGSPQGGGGFPSAPSKQEYGASGGGFPTAPIKQDGYGSAGGNLGSPSSPVKLEEFPIGGGGGYGNSAQPIGPIGGGGIIQSGGGDDYSVQPVGPGFGVPEKAPVIGGGGGGGGYGR